MNKIERPTALAGYDQDFALWSTEQARLLREGRFEAVDLENVAEEIESLGRSDKREIGNRIGVILLHLLKWEFQPSQRKPGWLLTLNEQRDQVSGLIAESPSLRHLPEEASRQSYAMARRKAAVETELPIKLFPLECPYAVDQILSLDFHPGEPWSREQLYRD